MNLITSQSAQGLVGQRVMALPVAGIPDRAQVSAFYLEVLITNATRGGAATAMCPSELQQGITLYQHTPGNSRFSVNASGHRLSYNRYLATSKRVGSGITAGATSATFSTYIPCAPLQGVGSINRAMRPFGSELNGSTVQITTDFSSAALGGVGGQFASIDLELRLYAQWREPSASEAGSLMSGRLAILDSDDFVGSTLSLSDGLCTLLAIESRAFTSVSVTCGGYVASTANTPFACDLASQPFQLSSEPGATIGTGYVTGLTGSDVYLANYPKQDDGALVEIGISRVYDFRNHQDAPEGPVVMTMAGRPASTAIGYLAHYIR